MALYKTELARRYEEGRRRRRAAVFPFFAEWRIWAGRVRKNLDSTINTYAGVIDSLAAYAVRRGWDLINLNPEQIQQWLRHRGGVDMTVAKRYTALQSYYSFLVTTRRRTTGNPMVHVSRPRVTRRAPRPHLDAEDKIRVLPELDQSIADLVAETGVTISELVSIDLRSEVGEQILVESRRGQERPVQLTRRAQAALRKIGRLIPNGRWMSKRTIERRLADGDLTVQAFVTHSAQSSQQVAVTSELSRPSWDTEAQQQRSFTQLSQSRSRLKSFVRRLNADVGASSAALLSGPLTSAEARRLPAV